MIIGIRLQSREKLNLNLKLKIDLVDLKKAVVNQKQISHKDVESRKNGDATSRDNWKSVSKEIMLHVVISDLNWNSNPNKILGKILTLNGFINNDKKECKMIESRHCDMMRFRRKENNL